MRNPQESEAAARFGVDADLADEVAQMIWNIEGNYNREGSGPGSRFEGQRLEFVQACAVIRRAREVAATDATRAPAASAWELRAAATGGGPCRTCRRPYYTHVCLSCSPDSQTPGPGCGNCRDTGMDQTPCTPAGEVDTRG